MNSIEIEFYRQYPSLRYCKIYPNQKRPVGASWELNPYEFDEVLSAHNTDGYGIGLLCGNGTVILDIDDMGLATAWPILKSLRLSNGLPFNAPLIQHSGDKGKFILHAVDDPSELIGKDKKIKKAFNTIGMSTQAEYLYHTGLQGVITGVHPDSGVNYHLSNITAIPSVTNDDLLKIALALGGSLNEKVDHTTVRETIEQMLTFGDLNMPDDFFLKYDFHETKQLASKVSIISVLDTLGWDYSDADDNNYKVNGKGGLFVTKDGSRFMHFIYENGGYVFEFVASYIFELPARSIIHNSQALEVAVWWLVKDFQLKKPVDKDVIEHKGKYINEIQLINKTVQLAPTGAGKTTSFINIPNVKMVILLPTVVQVRALAKEHNATAVHSKIEGSLSADLIIATYNSGHKVPNKHLYWVVLDEMHRVISDFFRWGVMVKVIDLLEEFKGWVATTATLPPLLPFVPDRIIHHRIGKVKPIITNMIVDGSHEGFILNRVRVNCSNNVKTILYVNNRRAQSEFSSLFKSFTTNIAVINSKSEEVKESLIPDSLVIITTCILFDGHSLYTVYPRAEYIISAVHKPSPLELIQLVNRVRNVNPSVINLWGTGAERVPLSFGDTAKSALIKVRAEDDRKLYEELAEQLPSYIVKRIIDEPVYGNGILCKAFALYRVKVGRCLPAYERDLRSYGYSSVRVYQKVKMKINITLGLTELELEEQKYMIRIYRKLNPSALSRLLSLSTSRYTSHYHAWQRILMNEPSDELIEDFLEHDDSFTDQWYELLTEVSNYVALTSDPRLVEFYLDKALTVNSVIDTTTMTINKDNQKVPIMDYILQAKIKPEVSIFLKKVGNGKKIGKRKLIEYLKPYYILSKTRIRLDIKDPNSKRRIVYRVVKRRYT